MNNVLCGRCALDACLPLDARIRFSKSLEPYTVYVCSHCHKYLYFDGFRWFKTVHLKWVQSLADADLQKPKFIL